MSHAEIISDLKYELYRIEVVIKNLETVAAERPSRKAGSGRIFMGEAERREVSARMKKHWHDKRLAQTVAVRVYMADA
jgi:hypothetical protein